MGDARIIVAVNLPMPMSLVLDMLRAVDTHYPGLNVFLRSMGDTLQIWTGELP